MSLDLLLREAATHHTLTIPAGWGQGRATYGGLVAGLLYSRLLAALGDAGKDRVLRSATVSFIGAVNAGEISLTTEIFRSGKSVTQAEARLIQNGEVQAVLLASFGAARSSIIHIAPASAPVFKAVETLTPMPYIAGLMPEFLQQLDMRWSYGAMPFAGAAEPDFGGWMRWREDFAELTTAHLFALIDAWPPSMLGMFKTLTPASSLCWTLELLASPTGQSSQNWWQYQVKTDIAKDGYGHAVAHIWDDAGHLVAVSRQTVTIFA